MPSRSINDKLSIIFTRAIKEEVFPGAVVGISSGPPKQRTTTILSYGTTTYPDYSNNKKIYPVSMNDAVCFDLASLTKPLATLLAILSLIKRKTIDLNDKLPDLLGDPDLPAPLRKCRLAHLLRHSSGLPAHKTYFTELNKLPQEERIPTIRRWILAEQLAYQPGEKTIYSDLGYIILSWIIEVHSGQALDKFVQQNIYTPLDLTDHLFFNPGNQPRSQLYAPTENCPWRGKILVGQVHDDNCYALGGVSGHAGLFGDIKGVLKIGTHLLDCWHARTTHPNYNTRDIKKMTINHAWDSSWRMGFDTPSPSGSSSGHFLSSQSFGHLGFTGTSLWVDPTIDLVIVLLSNRVYPDRNNNRIKKFRTKFHDSVVSTLAKRRIR